MMNTMISKTLKQACLSWKSLAALQVGLLVVKGTKLGKHLPLGAALLPTCIAAGIGIAGAARVLDNCEVW